MSSYPVTRPVRWSKPGSLLPSYKHGNYTGGVSGFQSNTNRPPSGKSKLQKQATKFARGVLLNPFRGRQRVIAAGAKAAGHALNAMFPNNPKPEITAIKEKDPDGPDMFIDSYGNVRVDPAWRLNVGNPPVSPGNIISNKGYDPGAETLWNGWSTAWRAIYWRPATSVNLWQESVPFRVELPPRTGWTDLETAKQIGGYYNEINFPNDPWLRPSKQPMANPIGQPVGFPLAPSLRPGTRPEAPPNIETQPGPGPAVRPVRPPNVLRIISVGETSVVVSSPPVRRVRPNPGTVETKAIIQGPGTQAIVELLQTALAVTEGIDAISAVHGALPEHLQTENPTPQQMLQDLLNNPGEIDAALAVKNLIIEGLIDQIVGGIKGPAGDALAQLLGGRRHLIL